jgi:hypothetical protein
MLDPSMALKMQIIVDRMDEILLVFLQDVSKEVLLIVVVLDHLNNY